MDFACCRRGYPTSYSTVWVGLFAWGFGSTVLNFLMFGVGCTYLSGTLCSSLRRPLLRPVTVPCAAPREPSCIRPLPPLAGWPKANTGCLGSHKARPPLPGCLDAEHACGCLPAALKGTRAVAEEVIIERSLSKGEGLKKMAELVSAASGGVAAACWGGCCYHHSQVEESVICGMSQSHEL